MIEWAEIRRMHFVEGVAIKEIARRTGRDRKTIRRAIRSDRPPRYSRPATGSKLDPYREEICRLLRADETLTNTGIRERIEAQGYQGSKTILDDWLREIRPIICPARTYQRTIYRPGEKCQFDLWVPRAQIPVGWGQTRESYVVTAALGYSRAGAGALIFSKEAPDILWGMSYCLAKLGGLAAQLVWDREAAIHAGHGEPTNAFAAYCGQLRVGWRILEPADPESKGMLERLHRFMRSSFEPGRAFASELDYQGQLDGWFRDRANARFHRGIRDVRAKRLAAELASMAPLPPSMPATDRRFVIRVPAQPYLRWDTNDYSLDPRFAGRRVEVRVSQRRILATALGTGEIAARHRRAFTKHLTFTDAAHQAELDRLRGVRRRGPAVEVETRPLARYDELIPA